MATYTQQCSQVGSFSYAKYFTLYVTLTDRDGNPNTNKSYVDYNVYCQSSGSGSLRANHNLYFEINGQVIRNENVYVNVSSPNAYIGIASGTLEVAHNNDGSKSVWFNAYITASAGYGLSASKSDTFWLNTIPRASGISATTANIEESAVITINRASSSFTHTVTYSFGGLTGTIATKTSNTSIGWTIPSTFYAKIPNSKTGTGTLTCITYNGNTEIGTSTYTFTVTTSETRCKPELTATVVDINSSTLELTGDEDKLIKYKSTAKVTISATAKNSATISKKTANGINISGTELSIENVTTDTYVITVTDSRGYSTSETITKTMVNYLIPTAEVSFKRVSPTSSQFTLEYTGNFFNGNFGEENNVLILKWRYKEKDTSTYSSWSSLTPTLDGNSYSNGQTPTVIGSMFDYTKAYTFQFDYTDKLSNATITVDVSRGEPIVYWNNEMFGVNGDLLVRGNLLGLNVITAKTDRQNITIGTGWDRTTFPIDSVVQIGDGLEISNNSIVIGAGVSKILVAAQCSGMSFNVLGDKVINIRKNDTETIAGAYQSGHPDINWFDMSIPMCLAEVEEGDTINMVVSSGYAGTFEILGSYLTVIVIEKGNN